MNRRERRNVEKKLGLTKHYKTLSKTAKFDLQAERIILGKQRHEETREKIKQSLNTQDASIETTGIYTIAQTIITSKKIPIADALEEAKEIYSSYKKELK